MKITERIYKTVEEQGPLTAVEIANILGDVRLGTVRSTLQRLSKAGMIKTTAVAAKVGRGRKENVYSVTGYKPVKKAAEHRRFKSKSMYLTLEQVEKWYEQTRPKYIIEIEGPLDTNCHVWTATKNNAGYGLTNTHNVVVNSHRLALIYKLGRHIHPDLTASHLCHVALCCNPDHLIEESLRDNLIRGYKKVAA